MNYENMLPVELLAIIRDALDSASKSFNSVPHLSSGTTHERVRAARHITSRLIEKTKHPQTGENWYSLYDGLVSQFLGNKRILDNTKARVHELREENLQLHAELDALRNGSPVSPDAAVPDWG